MCYIVLFVATVVAVPLNTKEAATTEVFAGDYLTVVQEKVFISEVNFYLSSGRSVANSVYFICPRPLTHSEIDTSPPRNEH